MGFEGFSRESPKILIFYFLRDSLENPPNFLRDSLENPANKKFNK
jgi:hypothetical protein